MTVPPAEAEAEPEMSGAAMPVPTDGGETAPVTVLPAELPRTVAPGTDGETLAGRDPWDGREGIVPAIEEVPAVSADACPEGEAHPVELESPVRIWSIEDEGPVTSSEPEPSSPPGYSSRPDLPSLTELTSRSGASVPVEADGLSSRLEEETLGWPTGHLVEAAPVAPASSNFREASTPVPAVAAREDALDVARGLAALMPALVGPLAIDVRVVDGITLLTATSWALGDDVATIPAALMLPLIYPGRAPWPVDQVTLRGPRAALILTPLGPLPVGGPVLAVSVRPGGALALLELRCRQAAAQHLAGTGAAVDDGGAHDERDEPDLLDVEPSTRTRELASCLGALGTVTASALRDADADRALYLFLPPGSDVRAVGALAHDVSSAMCRAAEAGVAFRTAVLRSGGRRIVIRLPAARSGPWGTIVAAGETAKPGLAYRQVEQAAAALGAL